MSEPVSGPALQAPWTRCQWLCGGCGEVPAASTALSSPSSALWGCFQQTWARFVPPLSALETMARGSSIAWELFLFTVAHG